MWRKRHDNMVILRFVPLMKLLVLVLSLLALPVAAQYSIGSHAILGGGGASAKGNFSISGNIGQVAPGKMAGGAYILEGGWSAVCAVQVVGSPRLFLNVTSGQAILTWVAPTNVFQLESNPDVALPANWSPVSAAPLFSGGTNCVIDPLRPGRLFYRLRQSSSQF